MQVRPSQSSTSLIPQLPINPLTKNNVSLLSSPGTVPSSWPQPDPILRIDKEQPRSTANQSSLSLPGYENRAGIRKSS